MSERDAYEPGVPCWVTTLQPDPDAAAGFSGAVFGGRAESAGGYLVARLRGRPVAAIAPLPPGVEPAPPPAWITHVSVADAEAAAEAATAAGGKALARVDEPGGQGPRARRRAGRPERRRRRPRRRGVLPVAAGRAPWRGARQRARGLVDEPPRHAGPGRRRRGLRRPVRQGARAVRARRAPLPDVPPARLRRRRARAAGVA